MSMKVCKAEVYKFKNEKGKTIPDYVIMNNYDGKFLEWGEVEPIGVDGIDSQIGCDGAVVAHNKSQANKIIDAFNAFWRGL